MQKGKKWRIAVKDYEKKVKKCLRFTEVLKIIEDAIDEEISRKKVWRSTDESQEKLRIIVCDYLLSL